MYLLHHFIYGLKEGSEKKYIYTLKTHFSTEEGAPDTILSCLPFFTFMKEGSAVMNVGDPPCGYLRPEPLKLMKPLEWVVKPPQDKVICIKKNLCLFFQFLRIQLFTNWCLDFFMLSSIMADNNCQKSLKKLTRWFLLLTVHRNWGELTSFYWSYFLCMGDVTLTQSRCYMQSMIPTHVTLLSWVKLILMYLN